MRLRSLLRVALLNLGVIVLLLLLIEGAASYLLFLSHVGKERLPAETRYSAYDPELGWSHRPGSVVHDLYGPGLDVAINAQGFRADGPTEAAAPPGKIRVLCSGDSFTFGFGVRRQDTWCQLLADHDARFDPVNMGQCGYGVDQAFLWYRRSGARLAHQVHVLAFVTPDFARMESTTFGHYGKPVLDLDRGALTVHNVPVPRVHEEGRLFLFRSDLERLRTSVLLGHLFHRAAPKTDATGEAKTRAVLHAIFEELDRTNKAQGSQLVLLYIPLESELSGAGPADWIAFVHEESLRLGIPLVDLFPAFRELPYRALEGLYIPPGQIDLPGAAGHLTVEGYRQVAAALAHVITSR